LTAHKTAIAYDLSTPVARWHARTCKALVCPQAVRVPGTRQSLTPYRAQFCPITELPPTPLVQLCPSNGLDQRARTIENA